MLNGAFRYCDSNGLPKFKNVSKTVGMTFAIAISVIQSIPTDYSFSAYSNMESMQATLIYEENFGTSESEGNIKMNVDARKYENIKLLDTISSLGENWNGYGGTAFSEESTMFFKKIISKLNVQPIISPTGRESLYLEYSDGQGTLGFEAFENKVDMAFITDNGNIRSETIRDNFDEEINKIVKKYYERSLH